MIKRFATMSVIAKTGIIVLALVFNQLLNNAEGSNINLGIEITEIMYDSPLNDSGGEWLEGQNPNGTPGRGEDTPLPVAFSNRKPKASVSEANITAFLTEKGVEIQWVAQTEVNNLGFLILRSKTEDGPFESITPKVIEGAGSSATQNRYTFLDEGADANTTYFYRIESVDLFGNKQTSPIVKASSPSSVRPKESILTTLAKIKKRR